LGYATLPLPSQAPPRPPFMPFPREPPSPANPDSPPALTMGYFSRVGTVFNAATTEWARVLGQADVNPDNPDGPPVAAITSNVVRALRTPLKVAACADFDGDGYADIVLFNSQSGAAVTWLMRAASPVAPFDSSYLDVLHPAGHTLVSAADIARPGFGKDGKPDLIWYNQQTGEILVWFVDGFHVYDRGVVDLTQDTAWTLIAAADFDADGNPDLIFQNRTTGQMAVWYLNGTSVLTEAYVHPVQDPAYRLVAAFDINADGKMELIFHNPSTGEVALWWMTSDLNYVDGTILSQRADNGWVVVGAGDFNAAPGSHCQLLLQSAVTNQLQLWTLSPDGGSVTATQTLRAIP